MFKLHYVDPSHNTLLNFAVRRPGRQAGSRSAVRLIGQSGDELGVLGLAPFSG